MIVHTAYWTMHTLEQHSPAVPLMAAETCTLAAIRQIVVTTAFMRDILYTLQNTIRWRSESSLVHTDDFVRKTTQEYLV